MKNFSQLKKKVLKELASQTSERRKEKQVVTDKTKTK
jgi:hypothetical protein